MTVAFRRVRVYDSGRPMDWKGMGRKGTAMGQARTTRRRFLKALGLGVAAMAAPRDARAAAPAARKPNLLLVLTDDQGWTDTSVPMMADRPDTRSDFYQTPNLERLAREGMVFSNAYAPAPTCTPTRGSIQFGKTPARLRQTVVHDVLAQARGIDCKNEVSIAQMVKAADPAYATAHFGKWGFPPRSPEHAGYDVTDGNTNNGEGDWLSLRERTPLPPEDPKRIFSLAQRAGAFMAKCVAERRPFFMQVSHYAPHAQHAALDETIARCRARPRGAKGDPRDYADPPPPRNGWGLLYAAMVEDLDTGLGRLLGTLDDLGIADNTYVFFTSDNGGGFRGNAPLRGGKADLWEGGIRVPTVVRGPGVRAGCHCDVPVAGWDFFPTISDLISNTRPLPDGLDGGSLRPLFEKGNAGRVARGTEALLFHFPWYDNTPMSAIRLGDYKLVKDLNPGRVRLFNLTEDLGETKDLSASMPGKAADLHKQLTDYLAAVDAESLDDMRAARKKELLGYLERTKQEISEWQAHADQAGSPDQKKGAEDRLREARARLKTHEAALDRLEKARKTTAW